MIISQIEYQVGNTGLTETTENGVETIVVIGDKISVKKITNFLFLLLHKCDCRAPDWSE